MAYIGKSPVIGNFVKLDAISVVNGQAAYTMQNGGSNFTDYESVNQFLVSLNGTIQAPTDSFTVSGSTLTFASNLSTGDVIDFIMVFGNSLSAGTPTDATVTTAKLSGALVTPSTLDVNGNELILDADADTSITADTDDQIDFKTGGTDAATIDSSANLKFNSGFGSVSTAYGVRAWIRFDGTGTISIDASGGVSSIADVGTGSYTINLSPSMPDVNYSIAVNPANGLLSTGNQQFPVTVCDWVGSSSFTVNVRQCDNNDNTFVSADGDPISVIVSR
jgi:hypothetical protein